MDDQNLLIDAFTGMAPQYERKVDLELRRFWGWSYADLVDEILALTSVSSNDRVLDIATGTSFLPRRMSQAGNQPAMFNGLDITYKMLKNAQAAISSEPKKTLVHLTCGSAHTMPYRAEAFDLVTCGLASHHMDLDTLLSEVARVLAPGGRLTIADVGGAPLFKLLGIKQVIRFLAFGYFLITEGPARARAESGALSHVFTAEEWTSHLIQAGFSQVQVTRLETRRNWTPAPLVLRASKL
jgi:ubiquinone/menaquinone biosynthesis C-methylase UbiE